MRVFVLDCDRQPLDPCSPARARKLLKAGRAAVFRQVPFTIILKDRRVADSVVHPHQIKIDPGSKVTGFALLQMETGHVVWAAELHHRSKVIHANMQNRAALRRARRNRKTRHRAPRHLNRHPVPCVVCGRNARHAHPTCRLHTRQRPDGGFGARWLAPSLEHRVATTLTWVARLQRWVPVPRVAMELVRFDLQQIEQPAIDGVEYQQGTLAGYELKEYLLEKWGHTCAYCGGASDDPVLNIDHVVPRRPRSGPAGTNRVHNLVIACRTCNKAKDNLELQEWFRLLCASRSPMNRVRAQRIPRVFEQLRRPLTDATAVNSTRWALFHRLVAFGLLVETGSGGRTKWNRVRRKLPKAHWVDAACVGVSTPDHLMIEGGSVLRITAKGHGRRQRCGTDRYGFPIRHAPRAKRFGDFATGDLVRAVIPIGRHMGIHVGRVAIRHRPCFRLNGFDVHPKYLRRLQWADGYDYTLVPASETVAS